jgi:hypothetical protein
MGILFVLEDKAYSLCYRITNDGSYREVHFPDGIDGEDQKEVMEAFLAELHFYGSRYLFRKKD